MNGAAPEAFAAYIEAFNRADYAAFGDYYTDDVVLVIGGTRELRGKQAIFDFYKDVKAKTRRTIRIVQSFAEGDYLAAELESEFLALEDLPDFQGGPLAAGDRMHINTFVIYELEGGRYARIRSATLHREFNRAPGPASLSQPQETRA